MDATIAAALGAARQRIAENEARILLRSVLDVTEVDLIAHPELKLSQEQHQYFTQLIERRAAGAPVAYLTGHREFFGRNFKVTSATLIPRPETELLVEFALEHLHAGARALDLGTGSGCIAISIACERPAVRMTAVDISPDALRIAQENAQTLEAGPIQFLLSDWFTGLAEQHFEIIVANPPYIAASDPHLTHGDVRHEPQAALVAGDDGLGSIRRIVAAAPRYLDRGGRLVFEHGYDQGEHSRALLTSAGFERVFTQLDLAGHERISGGVLP